jgi:hypothetical protein
MPFTYLPYRAFRARPYFDEMARIPPGERRGDELLTLPLIRAREAFGPDARDDPHAAACAMQESWFATAIAEFFGRGEAIFHISRTLRDALAESDLGDAMPADIRLPFDAVYVHLGTDLGLTFNDGATRLEGVFLARRGRHSSLMMTLAGELLQPPTHWGERGMESYTFYFTEEDEQRPLLACLEERLRRESHDPEELGLLEGVEEEERAEARRAWAKHSRERELAACNLEVSLKAAQLVANALLYLAQYPEDVQTDWQDGTPEAFRHKVATSSGKARERNLSKARSSGFTLVRKVGALFDREEAAEPGASPSPHLRRAHWRRQAHGPGLALRKLVWIRAVRVLGGMQRDKPYLLAQADRT